MLEQLGHIVDELELPTVSPELIPPFVLMAQAGLAEYEDIDWEKVEPHIAHQYTLSHQASAADYVRAVRELELVTRRELVRFGRDFDVVLTPTSAIEPPEAGSVLAAQHAAPDTALPEVIGSVSFTAFGNLTGLPAISLPLHHTDAGLPIGVQLTGGPWQEATLIRLAAQLEQAHPWRERRPSLAGAA
jgi:amidase